MSGVIDTPPFFSAEPHIGIGDSYTGNLMFDVGPANLVSNVSGDIVINGNFTNFTGYIGSSTVLPSHTDFVFTVSPFGGGAGDYNIEKVRLGLAAPGLSFSSNLFDFVTTLGNSLERVSIIAEKVDRFSTLFSVNTDLDPLGDITVSTVPSPAALPFYGASIAILGFAGWRKKWINT